MRLPLQQVTAGLVLPEARQPKAAPFPSRHRLGRPTCLLREPACKGIPVSPSCPASPYRIDSTRRCRHGAQEQAGQAQCQTTSPRFAAVTAPGASPARFCSCTAALADLLVFESSNLRIFECRQRISCKCCFAKRAGDASSISYALPQSWHVRRDKRAGTFSCESETIMGRQVHFQSSD